MGIALPVIIMAMFVYVFGGAIDTGMQYVDYVVPGIILLCAGYGAATTAIAVASDMTGGLMNRSRSLPMRPRSPATSWRASCATRSPPPWWGGAPTRRASGRRPTPGAGWR